MKIFSKFRLTFLFGSLKKTNKKKPKHKLVGRDPVLCVYRLKSYGFMEVFVLQENPYFVSSSVLMGEQVIVPSLKPVFSLHLGLEPGPGYITMATCLSVSGS